MIKIYAEEADLSTLISSNTSIAYQQEISPLSSDLAKKANVKAGLSNWIDGLINLPIKAGELDSDLHYVQSILVTTNWNKNDDVFDATEVWNARHTPQHKPTNVGHDEHEIVGHMTTNWVIDEDGHLIDDNISMGDLPNLFHVVNGSVIYKAWTDEKLLLRAHKLIEDIDAGRKFVSMECMFTGFDYAVLTPDNQSKVIARSDETSFLTKHLRAYGGTGLYEGFKIGRLLRNITFTGKGFVDKPANPNSIIFDKENFFNFAEAQHLANFDKSGVCIAVSTENKSNEEILMTEFMQEQNTELKSQINDLNKQLSEANERLAKSNVEKFEKTINKMEDELKLAQAKIDELSTQIDADILKSQEMVEELQNIKVDRDTLQAELDKVKANELRTNRISSLVDGGINKEDAEKKVDIYASLSDEQFTDLAKELIEVAKIKNGVGTTEDSTDETQETESTDSEDIQDEEQDDAEADVEELDSVEQDEDADLSTADTSDTSDTNDNDIRSKLSRAFASMLGKDDSDNSEEEN